MPRNFLFVAVPLLFAVFVPTQSNPRKRAESLESATPRIVSIVASGDAEAFVPLVAAERRLIVVDRYWNTTKGGWLTEPWKRADDVVLPLHGITGLEWVEREVEFGMDQLRTSQFRRVFKAFSAVVRRTHQNWPSWAVDSSRDMSDAWGSRRLGAAIEGKTASNQRWYIYLTGEAGRWRVWRLEVATH
jgi:hypothetical protein